MSSYKREDKQFKAKIAAQVKPLRKQTSRLVTVTIDEQGDVIFLATESTDVFLTLGNVVTKRASHVEPGPRFQRWFFHLLRALFGDKGRVSNWTRGWKTLWRVNTKPVGGPILTWKHIWQNYEAYCAWTSSLSQYNRIALWSNRQEAIDAEIKFLNEWFLERGLKSL